MRAPSAFLRRFGRVLCCGLAVLLSAGAAVSGAPAAAPATPSGALVDRVLAAYGGKAALAGVKAYRMEGTISSVMQGTGPMTRAFARPDRLRIELNYPGRREARLLDGSRGWRTGADGKLGPVDGFLLSSMALQAARANLPWLLDERRASLKLLAPSDGGKLQGLEVPLGEGLVITAHVETATGRIARSVATLDVPGMSTGFVADYSDFRTVDGVLFPFREANFASGQATGQTTITEVVVNPPLTDKDFRP